MADDNEVLEQLDRYAKGIAHCSCYGYEGQFQPEETTAQYLLSKHAGWFSEDAKASEWITTNIHL